jgi:hypothetical protein
MHLDLGAGRVIESKWLTRRRPFDDDDLVGPTDAEAGRLAGRARESSEDRLGEG